MIGEPKYIKSLSSQNSLFSEKSETASKKDKDTINNYKLDRENQKPKKELAKEQKIDQNRCQNQLPSPHEKVIKKDKKDKSHNDKVNLDRKLFTEKACHNFSENDKREENSIGKVNEKVIISNWKNKKEEEIIDKTEIENCIRPPTVTVLKKSAEVNNNIRKIENNNNLQPQAKEQGQNNNKIVPTDTDQIDFNCQGQIGEKMYSYNLIKDMPMPVSANNKHTDSDTGRSTEEHENDNDIQVYKLRQTYNSEYDSVNSILGPKTGVISNKGVITSITHNTSDSADSAENYCEKYSLSDKNTIDTTAQTVCLQNKNEIDSLASPFPPRDCVTFKQYKLQTDQPLRSVKAEHEYVNISAAAFHHQQTLSRNSSYNYYESQVKASKKNKSAKICTSETGSEISSFMSSNTDESMDSSMSIDVTRETLAGLALSPKPAIVSSTMSPGPGFQIQTHQIKPNHTKTTKSPKKIANGKVVRSNSITVKPINNSTPKRKNIDQLGKLRPSSDKVLRNNANSLLRYTKSHDFSGNQTLPNVGRQLPFSTSSPNPNLPSEFHVPSQNSMNWTSGPSRHNSSTSGNSGNSKPISTILNDYEKEVIDAVSYRDDIRKKCANVIRSASLRSSSGNSMRAGLRDNSLNSIKVLNLG